MTRVVLSFIIVVYLSFDIYKNFGKKYHCIDIEGKMFRDEFKERYTTIPFAIHRTCFETPMQEILSHQHREIELIAMEEGCADFYIDSELYKAKAGDVLLIPPYAIHRIRMSGEAVSSHLCICFDLKLLCDEDLKNGLENYTLTAHPLLERSHPDTALLARLIESAFSACEKSEAGWELAAVGSMSLFFGILKKNAVFTPRLQDKKEKEFGKNTMAYITEHFADSITSHTAAKAFFMNHSYFCRLFKKTFGCCFSEYILAYRLEKAKHSLAGTTLPVSQIASATGFNSFSYFGKKFKEKFGLSPLNYRKSAQELLLRKE